MKKSRPRRPTPALVVAIVALVFAMVGTGYAAFKLPAKSVGTKQLKANAVTTAKVKAHAITGKKLKLKSIGTVPNASHATLADTANALPAAGPAPRRSRGRATVPGRHRKHPW